MALAENRSSDRVASLERNVWLTLPNTLTFLRLLAIIPFCVLAMQGKDTLALIVFALAGLTDALDGAIARLLRQASKVGRLLDPVADKLYNGVSYVVLSLFRSGLTSIPIWVMAAVLARDVYILAGSFVVYRSRGNTSFKPSIYGKLNTLIEIGVVVCFLAAGEIRLAPTLPYLYVLLLVSILISAADYSRTGLNMMRGRSSEI
jgi:cardiolipin synthase (CMP-forming)